MSYRRYIYNKDELIFMNQNLNSTDSVLSNNLTYLGADPYLRTLVIPDCIKKGSHLYASKSTIKPNLHQSKGEHRAGSHHYHHTSHPTSGGGSGDGPNSYGPPNPGLGNVYNNGRSDKYFGHSHHHQQHYNHHPNKQHSSGVWYHGEHQVPPYARQSSHHEDSGSNVRTEDRHLPYHPNFGSKERAAMGGADYGSGTQPRRRIYSESSQRDPSAGRDQVAKHYAHHNNNNNNYGIYKTGLTPKASQQYQHAQGPSPPVHTSFGGNDKVQFNASKSGHEGGWDFGLGPVPPPFITSSRSTFQTQGQAADIGQSTMSSGLGSEQRRTASPSNLARRRNLTYTSSGEEGAIVGKSGALTPQEMLKPPVYHHSGTSGHPVGSSLHNKVSVTDLSSITNSPLQTHYYTPLTSPRWDSSPHNPTHTNPHVLPVTKELETFSTGTTTTADIDLQLGSYLEATSSIKRTPKGYRLTPTTNSNRQPSPVLSKSEILFLYLSGHLRPWDSLSPQDANGSTTAEITVQDLLHPHHGNPELTASGNPVESLRRFREQLSVLLDEMNGLLRADKDPTPQPCSSDLGIVDLSDISAQMDVPKVPPSANESERGESGPKKKGKNKKNKGNESDFSKAAQLPTSTKQSHVEQKTKPTPVEPLTVHETTTESPVSIAVMEGGDKGSQKPGKKKKQNKKAQSECSDQGLGTTSKETGLNFPSQINHEQAVATTPPVMPSASPVQQMTSQGSGHEKETPVLAHPKYETVKQKSQDILSSLLTISPRVPSDFEARNNNSSDPKVNQNASLADKGKAPNKEKVKGSEAQPQIKSANTGEWQKIESRGKKSKKSTSNTGTK